jgi:hypothetical protein
MRDSELIRGNSSEFLTKQPEPPLSSWTQAGHDIGETAMLDSWD